MVGILEMNKSHLTRNLRTTQKCASQLDVIALVGIARLLGSRPEGGKKRNDEY